MTPMVLIKLHEAGEASSLTIHCGDLPVDEAISAAGHEPNGYFWEGVTRYLDDALASSVELDSEAGMFAAYGATIHLERLRDLIEPYLSDVAAIEGVIASAEAQSFDFDD
jgi:hypothetical protein